MKKGYRMRKNWMGLLVLLATVVMIGCGPKSETVTAPEVAPRDAVRQALEGLAESGQGGSEIGAIMADLDKLAAEDPALAESLKADANAMMTMSGEQVQAKAKEMLKKLEGGGSSEGPEGEGSSD
jgi:hypothetical protein